MPLNPSRRDTIGPPPRDVSDLAAHTRHQGSYLRSLDRGILGGRFATPKPVSDGVGAQIVGGGGEGDGTNYEWMWEDRYTVTALGTQTITLTYEPVEEGLFVRWHPNGHGSLPGTNELFSVAGNVVTITDAAGLFAVGDQFSFQYQFDPELSNAGDAFTGLTLVGTTTHYGPAPHPTSLALPAGTAIGDLIVLGQVGGLLTDPRLTAINVDVAVGRAADLSAVACTGSGTYWAAMIGVFRVDANSSGSARNTGSTSPASFPLIAGSGGIAVACAGFGLIDSSFDLIASPWTDAGGTGTGKATVKMGYWQDLTQSTTPAATVGVVSVSSWSATTIGFGG